MKKKCVKVAKKLINVFMVLLLVGTLISIGLCVFNLISYNVEVARYIYASMGYILLPYEFLAIGKIDGIFIEQSNLVVCLIIAIVMFILQIAVLSNTTKMFNGKYSSIKRNIAGVIANIIIFLFFAVFVIGCVIMSVKYLPIENAINTVGPEFIKLIKTNFGVNLITLLATVCAYIGAFVCIFAFVFFIVGMSHKSTKVKIVSSIYFYSSEYEEPTDGNKQSSKKNEEKKQESQNQEIPESSQNAKNLINKIMQLEELKNAGKISNADYTRLRQKAIERYKN